MSFRGAKYILYALRFLLQRHSMQLQLQNFSALNNWESYCLSIYSCIVASLYYYCLSNLSSQKRVVLFFVFIIFIVFWFFLVVRSGMDWIW